MKKIKIVCAVFLLFLITCPSFGQKTDDKAQAAYIKAEEYFNKNEYDNALDQLAFAERYTPEPEPKISYLKVNILKNQFAQSNTYYPKLQRELGTFFSITDKNKYSPDNYLQMVKLKADLERFVETDSNQSQKLLDGSNNLTEIDAYLSAHPNTFYLDALGKKKVSLEKIDSKLNAENYLDQRLGELDLNIYKAKRKSFRRRLWGGIRFVGGGALAYGVFTQDVFEVDDTQITSLAGGVAVATSLMGAMALIRGNHKEVKLLKEQKTDLLKTKEAITFSILPYHSTQFAQSSYGLNLKVRF